ncbi:MAG: diguanylate cyclase [Eubacterium sp.]|nr:diguanylate cyclase [Eubacterium sp.]
MADHVVVVDDDMSNLTMAGQILSHAGMHVMGLQSGEALLKHLAAEKPADIILLDIRMPEMDGFETLQRIQEGETEETSIPIVFLSADDDRHSEELGLAMGVSDYIKKPFEPEILVQRIRNILDQHAEMKRLREEIALDHMTGLLNKESIEKKIRRIVKSRAGCFCVTDLDSFKPVNDMFGHEMGDRVLILFSNILKKSAPSGSVLGRVGGDEFLLFLNGIQTEDEISDFTSKLNSEITQGAIGMNDEMSMLPLGVSIGAAFVPADGMEYDNLFRIADKALQHVKQNGKHGYHLAKREDQDQSPGTNLKTYLNNIAERNVTSQAMWMGQESFIEIYQYMMRYMERYNRDAYRLMVTAQCDETDSGQRALIEESMRSALQDTLRNSDFMMQTGEMQFFLFLPEVDEKDIEPVIERIKNAWAASPYHGRAALRYEAESIHDHVAKKEG